MANKVYCCIRANPLYYLYYSLFPARHFLDEKDDKMWMHIQNQANRSTPFHSLGILQIFYR